MSPQEKLLALIAERESKKLAVGVNVATGDPMNPSIDGPQPPHLQSYPAIYGPLKGCVRLTT